MAASDDSIGSPDKPSDKDATGSGPAKAEHSAAHHFPTSPSPPSVTKLKVEPTLSSSPVTQPDTLTHTGRALPCEFGNYVLLEEIGAGGMGVVYKARQKSPDRLVALKMIRAGQLATDDDIRRFRQEADQAASLDHPNIVPVYDFGEVGGQHYFSMKLVAGKPLSSQLRDYQNKPREAAQLIATAARAVHHVHQRQLLHRDLKPANILVDAQAGDIGPPVPHIADLGLARHLGTEGATLSGAVVGTPEYMAPEQARATKHLTTAADVYSLGAVLYALLTGRPPFKGDSVMETLEQVVGAEPVAPRRLNPHIPRDLETICLKCLAKEAVRRYGSAEALADDLERSLRSEPITARKAGRIERCWRWCKRNPGFASLTAGVTVLLIVGLVAGALWLAEARLRAEQQERAHDEGVLREQADANRAMAEQKAGEEANLRKQADMNSARAEQMAQKLESYLFPVNDPIGRRRVPGETNLDRLVRLAETTRYRLGDTSDSLAKMRADLDNAVRDRLEARNQLDRYRAEVASAQQYAYAAHMFFAQRAWQEGDLPRVRELLDRQNPRRGGRLDLRGFEWYILDRLVRAGAATNLEPITFRRHAGKVTSVSFSPDAKVLASGGYDKTVRLTDAESGKELSTLGEHAGPVVSVSFSPNGKYLATASGDPTKKETSGEVKLWDVASGKVVFSHKLQLQQTCKVAFSPDGVSLAVACGDGTVRICDSGTGDERNKIAGTGDDVVDLAFSPDSKRLAIATPKTVRVWDLKSEKAIRMLAANRHSCVAFSPDGKLLATASDGSRVTLWSGSPAWEDVTLRGHSGRITSLVFVQDGKRVITASNDRTLKVWDVALGEELLTLAGHADEISSVAASPDGHRLASGSLDGTVKIWNGTRQP